MKRHLFLSLLLTAGTASLAQARDARIATHLFADNEVITFSARPGFQSTISFGESERIENIAVGESGAWQVTPNRRADLLFIKPTTATAPVTNMTVVTNRHTYLFELRPGRGTPVYLLRFTYPVQAVPPENVIPTEAQTPAPIPTSQTQELPVNSFNFAWTMKGTRRLFPERVFDDGHAVYLAWSEGRALPAILSIGPDGKTEGPVNFSANGQYLVVDGFHSRLILRSGRDMAAIETTRTSPAEATVLAQTK